MNWLSAQIVVAAILAGLLTSVQAADDCSDRPGMSDMYGCFGQQLAASEKRIDALFHKMIAAVPGEYRKRLRLSQSTWQAYRNAQCSFQFAADDPRREIPCRLQMNDDREKFLTEEFDEECNGCIPYNK